MSLQITPTERHALQLLATGYSTIDVGTDLGIGTVETEILLKKLFAALGAATRTEAIALARKRGLVSSDPDNYRPGDDAGVASGGTVMKHQRGCASDARGSASLDNTS
jgi:DNA-binding CsgD family transcriptional regulator